MPSRILSTPPVPALIPFSEQERLQTLYRTELLDSAPDPEFDAITLQAADLFDSPIALISLVDRHRQWFLSSVGLEISETPRAASMCSHAILGQRDDILFVPDACQDQRFLACAIVSNEPFIRFYAGAPITTQDGHTIGVLCVLDLTLRDSCSKRQKEGLVFLAREVSARIDSILEAKSQTLVRDIKPIDAHVGQRLRELRVKNNVTHSRLAFELGVSARDISDMERGAIRIPAEQLLSLSEFLAVPISFFFDGFTTER
ncbi:MAG: GAF domain-containing protein [Hyphomicrobiaceae bacterium]